MGEQADAGVLEVLVLTFSGALLQAGMGLMTYDQIAERLVVRGRRDHARQLMTTAAPALVFDPYDYAFQDDPYPTYQRLRDEAPVFHAEADDIWVISRHQDVFDVLRNDTVFSNRMGVSLDASAWNPEAHRVMSFLGLDGVEQSRIRKLVSAAFTPRRVRELTPEVQALTERYLERTFAAGAEHGEADWIRDFAGLLPMDVISEMMGVPAADRDEVRRLADLVVHREDGVRDVPRAGMEASFALFEYYGEMVAQRRRSPTDDLTSALIAAELDGDRLTDGEIMAFLFLMVVAGNETTTKLLGNALFHLAAHPGQKAQVLADVEASSRRGSRRRCATTRPARCWRAT